MKQLFCDCKTDDEKSAFFLSGRAVETGVIAQAISNDVSMAYHRCSELKKELEVERMRLAACGVAALGYFNGCAKEYESSSLYDVMELRAKNEELRAKIERMEKQEPVAWAATDETCRIVEALSFNQSRRFDTPLYALPGAQTQPAPSINEGVRKVTLSFRWESEAQHHIPTIEIEFDPVSPGSPNDARGWQDRDRIAAMLTPKAKT